MKKNNKLNYLLSELNYNNLYFELINRSELINEDNYYIIIKNKKYNNKKYLYFNLRIDNNFIINKITLIINYKDENHAFINIRNIHDLIILSYDYFL